MWALHKNSLSTKAIFLWIITTQLPHCWFQKHFRKQRAKAPLFLKQRMQSYLMRTLIRSASGVLITCPWYIYNILSSSKVPAWKNISTAIILLRLFWLPYYWWKCQFCAKCNTRWHKDVEHTYNCTGMGLNFQMRNSLHIKELDLPSLVAVVFKLWSPDQQRQ